jgi:hypothetical protein
MVEKIAHVESCESSVTKENLHVQVTRVNDVPLTDFNEATKLCAGSPAVVEQIAGERIEDNIHTTSICRLHDSRQERRVARIENVFRLDPERLCEEVLFILGADCGKYLSWVRPLHAEEA